MTSSPTVVSEVGRLQKVIIHRPGLEWDLVPCGPHVLEKYLIEDIFVLSRAQQEHDCFTEVLRLFLGKDNVIEILDLLVEVCQNPDTKREIIGAVTALELLGLRTVDALSSLDPKALADVLLRGAVINEEGKKSGYENLFPPLPNMMFTRDLGVSIPGAFVVANAATKARRRETLLMRYILRNKLFKDIPMLDILELRDQIFWRDLRTGEAFCLEGGDILVLDECTLFVGTGQRTTESGFFALLDTLKYSNTPIKRLVRAPLPNERASMHLDTVITATDRRQFIAYKPVIEKIEFELYRYPFERNNKSNHAVEALMRSLDWHETKFLSCGGDGDLFSSREQWTDGANLFAIAPGILLGYDRNEETAKVLKEQGYKYIEPDKSPEAWAELGEIAARFKENQGASDKVLIGLPGSELSRARGGPRCMTLPIARDL